MLRDELCFDDIDRTFLPRIFVKDRDLFGHGEHERRGYLRFRAVGSIMNYTGKIAVFFTVREPLQTKRDGVTVCTGGEASVHNCFYFPIVSIPRLDRALNARPFFSFLSHRARFAHENVYGYSTSRRTRTCYTIVMTNTRWSEVTIHDVLSCYRRLIVILDGAPKRCSIFGPIYDRNCETLRNFFI